MIPAVYNFPKGTEGDTNDGVTVTVKSDGVAVNLTNITIAMQARSTADAVVLNLTVGSGLTKTNAAGGVFKVDAFTMPAAGTYNYDIQFTYADGSVKTYMSGFITSVDGVTA